MNDPYATLGVARHADFATIQAAYRRLMREHHPDRAGAVADSDRAQAINAAFAVLKDPQRRARYDAQHRQPAPSRTPQPPDPFVRVRRRGPTLEARQRRLRRVRLVRRGLLVGAFVLVGLGLAGTVLSYRTGDLPWRKTVAMTTDRVAAAVRQPVVDRLG